MRTTTKYAWIGIVLSVITLTFGVTARAVTFSQMTVFGDSLSDVGNISDATFGITPGSGYFDGRFSNGPLYVEYLAEGLSLATPTPSREGGRNYAHGGAWAGDQPDFFSDLVIQDLEEQVPNYLSGRTPAADELFVVFAGSNDLIESTNNVGSAIASLDAELNRLAEAGARQFFVPNLPRLDLVPRSRGTSAEVPLRAAVASFNVQLDAVLDDLESDYADAAVYRLDVATIFSDVFADPTAFGFTNVTDSTQGLSGIDPATYLFWDDLHPTTAGHELLADFALDAILGTTSLVGDYNGNGEVDAADYTIWADSFGSTLDLAADGNGDGVVDAADYTIWADNFGNATPLNADALRIPEPTTLAICGLAGGLLACRRFGIRA
ncbi:MAG: SGNH/GDSL hydrolase family protein [Planctomycetota bacterium]